MSDNREQAASDALVEKFERIHGEAHDALAHLERFWTSLYGPNEALTAAFEALDALPPTFYGEGEEVTT